jgi:hypothetical protein
MTIPCYPEFAPLSLDLKNETHSMLSLAPDGVSEFSFPGLYLFRKRYQYRISLIDEKTLILSGIQPPHLPDEESRTFFLTPCAAPGRDVLLELFKNHDFWKNIPDSILIPNAPHFEEWGIEISEDRNNFDYLYLRSDLAELAGKKYHKKRNLIAQFNSSYEAVEKTLSPEIIPHALEVLEGWKLEKGEIGDYSAALEVLELFQDLNMQGCVYYIEGKAAAWCLGEAIAQDSIFTIHFEKALDKYKGIYQYMNKSFASSLPENIIHINREQDLGDEGLQQAKMSYRPSGFVRKHTGILKT